MNLPILAGEHITKYYENEPIIEDVSIHLNRGELVSLLGVSGIGKTTLFHILSGLEYPDNGRVLLNGNVVTGISGKVSYMQQKDLLLPFQTVIDNVCVPMLLKGVSKKEARKTASTYFSEFGLDGSENKYPSQLSGGMRQRAALLRSYLFSGEIMLLDEPFSALDAITKASMHKWYKNISIKHNTSSFFITHDIDEAILLSDRIYIMSGVPGRIHNEIKVDYEGIRDREFALTDTFIEYKREILSIIGK